MYVLEMASFLYNMHLITIGQGQHEYFMSKEKNN